MKSTLKSSRSPGTIVALLKSRILTGFRNNHGILRDTTQINLNRIFYLSAIAAPIRVLDIILFSRAGSASAAWSRGIILSHSVLLVFWTMVLFTSSRLRKMPRINYLMHLVQYIVPIVTLLFGIVIVAIDQLVTTSITPFLIVCVATGSIFLLRPWVSISLFLASYIIYYNLIALTITDHQVLLSNRVNGATAVAMGALISVMSWHYKYINITQGRRIKLQQRQLEQMAYHDSLTNLYNRHYFNEVIEKELFAIQRYGHDSVIILLDIDNFKDINDTFGHLTGDQVLIQFAQFIAAHVRKTDTVSRFGGEEFVILAPRTSLEAGVILAEKLRRAISQKPFATGETSSYITASFGVSLLKPTEGHESYFSQVDKALYLAKEKGKNRVEILEGHSTK
jgi:diguanylate cyclase (GGDEF)-like protein